MTGKEITWNLYAIYLDIKNQPTAISCIAKGNENATVFNPLGIHVLDHLIISEDEYMSMNKEEIIDFNLIVEVSKIGI